MILANVNILDVVLNANVVSAVLTQSLVIRNPLGLAVSLNTLELIPVETNFLLASVATSCEAVSVFWIGCQLIIVCDNVWSRCSCPLRSVVQDGVGTSNLE